MPDDTETETVVISKRSDDDAETNPEGLRERRFTAPGFDANETQVIATSADPETDFIPKPPGSKQPGPKPRESKRPGGKPRGSKPPGPQPPSAQQPPPVQPGPPASGLPPKAAVPQSIPARDGAKPRASKNQKLGWVLAIVVIVLALAAIAILLTVVLTKHHPKASQEDRVRQTIKQMDAALQSGDLATLRSITCGTTRDGYVEYDEHAWQETYHRVSSAKQYPVIASIDEVVVNGRHAEANVTTFMAYDPQVSSTRSIDLQFRDDQWKVCQSPSG